MKKKLCVNIRTINPECNFCFRPQTPQFRNLMMRKKGQLVIQRVECPSNFNSVPTEKLKV